jgi:hypothetical protein
MLALADRAPFIGWDLVDFELNYMVAESQVAPCQE